MKTDPLRVAALLAYLVSWIVLVLAAIAGALPRLRGGGRDVSITVAGTIGTLAQLCALLAVVLPTGSEPLRPMRTEMAGALLLSPLAAWLFVWAQRSAPEDGDTLVTTGAYGWLRHPIYLAFLLMLLATGLIVSAGPWLLLAVPLYVAGTELRIASEEGELSRRFAGQYAAYLRRTRWRYLPGLR